VHAYVAYRFYFLGDDDLLEILGQASNPDVIQSHLKKLYAGIHSVTLENGAILHMNSVHKEAVPLPMGVVVGEVVELWLNELTKMMKIALREELLRALQGSNAKKWVAQPSQIINLSQEVNFTMVCASLNRSAACCCCSTRCSVALKPCLLVWWHQKPKKNQYHRVSKR
jgi:dynein heavy chain 2, cytosolic